jgi:hypothetical protein
MKEFEVEQPVQPDQVAKKGRLHLLHVRPQLGVWAVLSGLMLALLLLLVQPALAAIELSYFYAIANPSSVILQWGTRSEFNVQGFEIQCKGADEPDIAFHRIGFVPAKGGPSTPAQYTFPVTTGMQPGAAYCFRILELTTDGTPGEAHDRCGFGPGVTPTPGALGVIPTVDPNIPPAVPTDAFGNPIVQPQATDMFGSPLPQPVATDAFGNPLPPQQFDAFGSPLPQPQQFDQFGNPIPQPQQQFDQFGNPIPQPQQQFDQFGNPITPTPLPQFDQFGNPIPQPQQQFDQFGNPIATDPFGSPLATPTFTPDPLLPPTPIVVTPLANDPRGVGQPPPVEPAAAVQGTDADLAYVEAPAPAYIVVTAAPTEPPVALGAAMTPLPTVTPTPPAFQLVNALAPTTQNLMIMLLCLTFTGASGIGILGLITSVMFMRSRSSQREFYDRYSLPPPSRRRQW